MDEVGEREMTVEGVFILGRRTKDVSQGEGVIEEANDTPIKLLEYYIPPIGRDNKTDWVGAS